MKSINKYPLILFFFLLFLPPLGGQETVSKEVVESLQEWRWGVTAYNNGRPGQALLSLERAASLNPLDPLIREWLGRAYWRSGLEDAALEVWDQLIREGESSAALQHQAEILRRRLNGEDELPSLDNWVPLLTLSGDNKTFRFFERPGVIRPLKDGMGTLLVSSYAGGEVILLSANGTFQERFDGGIEALDRPFDLLPLGDGRLLVSEFQADRISLVSMEKYTRGIRLGSWGMSGRGTGQFLGPQYMALSSDGFYFYVSDWGNRRISKWDLQGNQVLAMGDPVQDFPGLGAPGGIAVAKDILYVADTLRGSIETFDENGNYLGFLIKEGLTSPGALSLDLSQRNLLVADGDKIWSINLESKTLSPLAIDLGGGQRQITSLDTDENGNLIISDMDANELVLFSPLSSLYGGLEVTLRHVKADAYPQMAVELTVRDRQGNGIVGLERTNFILTDGTQRVSEAPVLTRGSTSRELETVIVADLSGGKGSREELVQGIKAFRSSLEPEDKITLIAAGRKAVLLAEDAASAGEALDGLTERPSSPAVVWDEALRLAGTVLAPGMGRKVIFVFMEQAPDPRAFDKYGLRETARYLANNDILLVPVYLNQNKKSREMTFLAKETGGKFLELYRPEGSHQFLQELRMAPSGNYTLVWRSMTPADFGRSYLPLAVEALFMNKSGRGELGAFAPLR